MWWQFPAGAAGGRIENPPQIENLPHNSGGVAGFAAY
jgi:hypothetical protein